MKKALQRFKSRLVSHPHLIVELSVLEMYKTCWTQPYWQQKGVWGLRGFQFEEHFGRPYQKLLPLTTQVPPFSEGFEGCLAHRDRVRSSDIQLHWVSQLRWLKHLILMSGNLLVDILKLGPYFRFWDPLGEVGGSSHGQMWMGYFA